MNIFKTPQWVSKFQYNYQSFEEIPQEIFDKINSNIDSIDTSNPVVSIVIPAFNEELNLLGCVGSLSENKGDVPFEIIVVNNNSTDSTQKLLDKLDIKSFSEKKIGPGAARQLGQENARGHFILTADADCIYPEYWVDIMYKALKKEGTSCVYGKYSFIGTEETPRWQLFIYEKIKDILSEIRHLKRPHLNSLGMSMGYPRELGLKIGFDTRNIVNNDGSISFVRGEDGRMCFDLSKFGSVRQVRSANARLWTIQRTLNKEGSLWDSLQIRIRKELGKFLIYFKPQSAHDTKQSEN